MTLRDEDKIIHSVVRWLVGAKPKNGRRYYFEKYDIAKKIKERLGKYRHSKTCPFCGRSFAKLNNLATHVLLVHAFELRRMIEEIEEEDYFGAVK